MKHMLRLNAEASLSDVQRALARVHAPRLGLTFPLGSHPRIANVESLQALYQHCQETGKEVVIFGGDAQLRASAVTSGFFVATTPDDWSDEAIQQQPTPSDSEQENLSWEWGAAPLTLLSGGLRAEADEWDDFAEEELPTFVQELLAADGAYADLRERTQAIGWSSRERFYRRHPISESELLRAADEYYEDSITAKIRVTGSPSRSCPSSLP